MAECLNKPYMAQFVAEPGMETRVYSIGEKEIKRIRQQDTLSEKRKSSTKEAVLTLAIAVLGTLGLIAGAVNENYGDASKIFPASTVEEIENHPLKESDVFVTKENQKEIYLTTHKGEVLKADFSKIGQFAK